MRMHRIEVDDEVYGYLEAKVERFVDTPNSVLRKELLGDNRATGEATEGGDTGGSILPQVPSGTPKALELILDVVHYVRNMSCSRPDATHRVADIHRVAYQTVGDKYGRQLNLTASEFDRLLEQPDLSGLRTLLSRKFSCHLNVIEGHLGR